MDDIYNVVSEDDYVDMLAKVIELEYFPRLVDLKLQRQYLDALDKKDVGKMQDIYRQLCVRKGDALAKDADTITLKKFHSTFTSQDNASYSQLQQRDADQLKQDNAWAYRLASNPIKITPGATEGQLHHASTFNAVMFPLTHPGANCDEARKKNIVADNTVQGDSVCRVAELILPPDAPESIAAGQELANQFLRPVSLDISDACSKEEAKVFDLIPMDEEPARRKRRFQVNPTPNNDVLTRALLEASKRKREHYRPAERDRSSLSGRLPNYSGANDQLRATYSSRASSSATVSTRSATCRAKLKKRSTFSAARSVQSNSIMQTLSSLEEKFKVMKNTPKAL